MIKEHSVRQHDCWRGHRRGKMGTETSAIIALRRLSLWRLSAASEGARAHLSS